MYLFCSVQFSRSVVSGFLQPHGLQHSRPPCPSPAPGVHPNPCPLCRRCHPTVSSSVVPFSSCPQSFPVSGSFPMSQVFTSGGQSTGVSASTSVLPTNTQDWSPLGWTCWVSLQSKGLSRVFSNTTVQKHQFFSSQLSLLSLTSVHNYWKNHSCDIMHIFYLGTEEMFVDAGYFMIFWLIVAHLVALKWLEPSDLLTCKKYLIMKNHSDILLVWFLRNINH